MKLFVFFIFRYESKSENNSEDESIRSGVSGKLTLLHTREASSLRKGLLKKREKVLLLINHLLH